MPTVPLAEDQGGPKGTWRFWRPVLPWSCCYTNHLSHTEGLVISCRQIREKPLARRAGGEIGPDKDIPHVTALIIVKYITDLQLLGLL
jgi:hypothetical protein